MVFLVESVFLSVHIGFVGVHSSEVSRVFFCTNGGFFWYISGFFWYLAGPFLVQNGGSYKVGGFLVGTTFFPADDCCSSMGFVFFLRFA